MNINFHCNESDISKFFSSTKLINEYKIILCWYHVGILGRKKKKNIHDSFLKLHLPGETLNCMRYCANDIPYTLLVPLHFTLETSWCQRPISDKEPDTIHSCSTSDSL